MCGNRNAIKNLLFIVEYTHKIKTKIFKRSKWQFHNVCFYIANSDIDGKYSCCMEIYQRRKEQRKKFSDHPKGIRMQKLILKSIIK